MSKSLAIWFEPLNQKQALDAELHVNFWKLPDSKGKKGDFHRFVDLGLKIVNANEVTSCNPTVNREIKYLILALLYVRIPYCKPFLTKTIKHVKIQM